MADTLNADRAGRINFPYNPAKITQALMELLAYPNTHIQLGKAARDRLLLEYSADRIVMFQEERYSRVIERRKAKDLESRILLQI